MLDVVEVASRGNTKLAEIKSTLEPKLERKQSRTKEGEKTPALLRGNVSKEKEEKEFPKLDSHLTPLFRDRSVLI